MCVRGVCGGGVVGRGGGAYYYYYYYYSCCYYYYYYYDSCFHSHPHFCHHEYSGAGACTGTQGDEGGDGGLGFHGRRVGALAW